MHKLSCNDYESFLDRKILISSDLKNTPFFTIIKSPAKRRDHLHLLKRRKSRARLLNQEERAKLLHFRKFFIHNPPANNENLVSGYNAEGNPGYPPNITRYEFIRRVDFLRKEIQSEVTHDEEGVKMTAKDLAAAKAVAAGQGKSSSLNGNKNSKMKGFR